MAGYNGLDLLARVDTNIARLRDDVASASRLADDAKADEASLKAQQFEITERIAAIQLTTLEEGNGTSLIGRDIQNLLNQHQDFVEEEDERLKAAATKLETLEQERADSAKAHSEAVAAVEAKLEEVEASLAEDQAYQSLKTAHEDAAAIAERAAAKHEVALKDREEKGAPYRDDPLFSYLWARRYRSPDYKAAPWFRTLDAWVAKLCKYDDAYLNYQRLTELPDRLAEHAERCAAAEAEALSALEAAEDKALAAAGAPALEDEVTRLVAEIEAIDAQIDAAETAHADVSQAYDDALRGAAGPAAKARTLVETRLAGMQLPQLRVLAAETVTLEDDQLVDELVSLRAEERLLTAETASALSQLSAAREDLKRYELFRKRLKSKRMDHSYLQYRARDVDRAFDALDRPATSPHSVIDQLRRVARRSSTSSSGFGHHRRSRMGYGTGDLVGDILYQVGREMMRGSGTMGGSWGGGGSRRRGGGLSHGGRRRMSGPRIRVGGGGFRTGGSRGGGGFRTGGGF